MFDVWISRNTAQPIFWALLGLGCFGGWCIAQSDFPRPVPQFENVTAAAGIHFEHLSGGKTEKKYLFEAKGGGVAFFDYDNDGWLDLLLVQGSTLDRFAKGHDPHCSLFRNNRDGTFADVTERAGLTTSSWGMGVSIGDYDNNGFADIYLTNLKENTLYRNQGDGTFRDVTTLAGVGDPRWSSSAAFGDYDGDGDLDLYVCNYISLDFAHLPEPGSRPYCNYRGRPGICGPLGLQGAENRLYRNEGDGTFTDVSEPSGTNVANEYFSLGVVWADLDNDGDLDIYVSNDSTPNQFYVNQGDGNFLEMGFLSGLAANADGGFQAGMGVDAADYDNDGLLDVFVTHFANDYSTLYRNRNGSLFEDVTGEAQLIQPEWLLVSWGTRFVDLDHDGWKDIVHANGHVYPFLLTAGWTEEYFQQVSVYLNGRDGKFQDVAAKAGSDLQEKFVGRGVAFADYDNDGDMDFILLNLNGSPQLFRNGGSPGSHWAMFRTRGSQSNRDGIGATLTLVTGGLRQVWQIKRSVGLYSASDPRAHFGLGRTSRIESLQVVWPSGKVQQFTDIEADAHYVLDETEGLSKEF